MHSSVTGDDHNNFTFHRTLSYYCRYFNMNYFIVLSFDIKINIPHVVPPNQILLATFLNFQILPTNPPLFIFEELVRSRGHICLYLPIYHCELNPIERNWCHAKKISRQCVNGTIVKLRSVIPTSLEAVTVEMNKFF